MHLLEGEDPFGALVVEAWPFAAFELGEGVDGDAAAAGGLAEDDRERPQRGRDRPSPQLFAAQDGDQAGDILDGDLVESAAAELRDQVLFERPPVLLPRAGADGLAVEPVACVLLEALSGRLDPLPGPAAEEEVGAFGFGVFERPMDDGPAADAAGVEVADLIRRPDLAVWSGPVVDAWVAADGPPPRRSVTLLLHWS